MIIEIDVNPMSRKRRVKLAVIGIAKTTKTTSKTNPQNVMSLNSRILCSRGTPISSPASKRSFIATNGK